MSFIVEDGTGLPDATSLVSVEFADDYFVLRNVQEWQGTNTEKEAWLVQATDYVSTRFNFKGWPLTHDQSLPFPREGEISGTPVNMLKAVCEYALRAKEGPLAPDPVVDESGWAVTSKTEKVGPIEDTKSYSSSIVGSKIMQFRPYPAADVLLKGLLRNAGRKVIRA